MKHFLIFGASVVHGVGSEHSGWVEKVKQSFHADLYGPSAPVRGQGHVYELGIPGTALPHILERLESELKARMRGRPPEEICIVLSAGTNDARVSAEPDQTITADDFAASVHAFIHLARDYSAHLLGVGVTPVDEAKVNVPEELPFRFYNERIRSFEQAFERTCAAEGIEFVPLFDKVPGDWPQTHLFRDGLHPNDRGHEWIRSQVEPRLRNLVGPLA